MKRRKPKSERKEAFLKVRLTEKQKVSVLKAARKTHDDVSSWARQIILQASAA